MEQMDEVRWPHCRFSARQCRTAGGMSAPKEPEWKFGESRAEERAKQKAAAAQVKKRQRKNMKAALLAQAHTSKG